MERSCRFYSQIPGFKLVYGSSDDTFTTFEIGEEEHKSKMCVNLELGINNNREPPNHIAENDNGGKRQHFGRIIFHTEDVACDIREPDGFQLSFAEPIAGNKWGFMNRDTYENGWDRLYDHN